ncbi:unnamed protein product [Didymodactylos carnosus]|uniref:Uncharacterized protein n=1 Tax=Didymodactylos carnosus TaxID=1234261 RepID=A0A8S2DKJ4_9BILA|nr:unnamed protein product [Didymodactylos carnosus]CAF3709573.1 unnamed protein product [Didymodactylos carnosus]
MANMKGPKSLMDEMIHQDRNFGDSGNEERPSKFRANDDPSLRGNSRGRGSYNNSGSRGTRGGTRGNFQQYGGAGYQHDQSYFNNRNNNNNNDKEQGSLSGDNNRKMGVANSVPPSLLGLNLAPNRHSSNYSTDSNNFPNKNSTFPHRGRPRFSNPQAGYRGNMNRFSGGQASFNENNQQPLNENFRQQQSLFGGSNSNNAQKSQTMVQQDNKQISQKPMQSILPRGNNDRIDIDLSSSLKYSEQKQDVSLMELNVKKEQDMLLYKTKMPNQQQYYQNDNRRYDSREENSRKEYDRPSRDHNSRTDRSRSPATRNDRRFATKYENNDRQFGIKGDRDVSTRGGRESFMNKREEKRGSNNDGTGRRSRFGSDERGFKGRDYDQRSNSQQDNREHEQNEGRRLQFPGAGYRNVPENRLNSQHGNTQQQQYSPNFPGQNRSDYNNVQQNYRQQGGMTNEQRSYNRLNPDSGTNLGRRQSRFNDRQTEEYDIDNKPLHKPEFQLPVAITTTPLYQVTNTATYSQARPSQNQAYSQQQQSSSIQSQINPQFRAQMPPPNSAQQSAQNQPNMPSYQQMPQLQQHFSGGQGYNWPSATSVVPATSQSQSQQIAPHSMTAIQQPNPYSQHQSQQPQSVNPYAQYGVTSNPQQTTSSTPVSTSQQYQNTTNVQQASATQQATSAVSGTSASVMDALQQQQQQWAQYCQQYWNYVQQQQALRTASASHPEQTVALQQQSQPAGHGFSSLPTQPQSQATAVPTVKQTTTAAVQDTSVASEPSNLDNQWSQYVQQWSQYCMQQPNASTSAVVLPTTTQPVSDNSSINVQQQTSLPDRTSAASTIPNYLSQLNHQQQQQQQGANSSLWQNWFNQTQ